MRVGLESLTHSGNHSTVVSGLRTGLCATKCEVSLPSQLSCHYNQDVRKDEIVTAACVLFRYKRVVAIASQTSS